jgi:hypothetical protein
VTGTYTAPSDDNAWFVQGILEFADTTDFDVSFFSIRRTQTSDVTEDFQMTLNGRLYSAGALQRFATREFPISAVDLADADGVIQLKASVRGNRYGMARLIYKGPLMMGRGARYKVSGVNGNTFDLTLTAKLSGFSNAFKLFPFSTKYGGVGVVATDGAGEHHMSTNKNQWISSDMTAGLKRVQITYPTPPPSD